MRAGGHADPVVQVLEEDQGVEVLPSAQEAVLGRSPGDGAVLETVHRQR